MKTFKESARLIRLQKIREANREIIIHNCKKWPRGTWFQQRRAQLLREEADHLCR